MDRNEIKQKLIDMLSIWFYNDSINVNILEYADLIDDLGMDSIMFISIVVEIENIFRITVPDDMLLMENFRNVESIIQIVEDTKTISGEDEKEQEGV